MKLSIIVPVYNVEQYIGPCLESVFRQGLHVDDYEVIVVDDGSPDGSMSLVTAMQQRHANLHIVTQANQGLSAARNTGLERASGDYVLFLDSDDLLVADTLPLLLAAAAKGDADMVVADFVKMDDEAIGKAVSPFAASPSALLVDAARCSSGHDFFLHEFNPQQCYVWRTLYRRRFLLAAGLRFVPGIYFEDVPFTTECYLRAGLCVRLGVTFYIYRQRANSIVSSVNMKKLTDFNTVLARLYALKSQLCATPDLRRRMDDTIFTTFSIAVWYLSHDKALLARRAEYVADLRQKVPALNFSGSMKQRLVSLLVNCMPETYIWLRSL